MTNKRTNWLHLIESVRENAETPPTVHEQIVEELPSYVDVYLSKSPIIADRTLPVVSRHLATCHDCSGQFDELLEMTRTPLEIDDQALELNKQALPEYLFLPEPAVHNQPRHHVLGILTDSLGNILSQIRRTIESPNAGEPAFRAASDGSSSAKFTVDLEFDELGPGQEIVAVLSGVLSPNNNCEATVSIERLGDDLQRISASLSCGNSTANGILAVGQSLSITGLSTTDLLDWEAGFRPVENP